MLAGVALAAQPPMAVAADSQPVITPVEPPKQDPPAQVTFGQDAVIRVRVSPRSRCEARLVGPPSDTDIELGEQTGEALTWRWTNHGHLRPGRWSIWVECGDTLESWTIEVAGFSDADCKTDNCFSPVVSSSSYSAVGGILAGFAFAAIVLLLTPGSGRSYSVRPTIITLLGALVCLMIGTFLFALTAGEEGVYPRSFLFTYIASLALAPGVLLVFFGIALLVAATDVAEAWVVRFATTVVVPLVTVVFIAYTGMEATDLYREDSGLSAWYGKLTAGIVIGMVGILGACLSSQRVADSLSITRWWSWASKGDRWVSLLVVGGLIVSGAAAVFTAWWGHESVGATRTPWFFILWTAAVALGAVLIGVEINRRQPDRRDKRGEAN